MCSRVEGSISHDELPRSLGGFKGQAPAHVVECIDCLTKGFVIFFEEVRSSVHGGGTR